MWLKEGDRNTSFFHRLDNAHKRRNALNKIRVNDRWLIDDSTIQDGVVDAFKRLLFEPGGGRWRLVFPDIALDVLEVEDSDRLKNKFSEEVFFFFF